MGIILRQNKGSELTFAEVDGNFQSLFYSASLIGNELFFYFPSSSASQSVDLSSLPSAQGVDIYSGDTLIKGGANILHFSGSGLESITTTGSNGVIITVQGGGSGNGGIFEQSGSSDVFFTTSSLQITGSTLEDSPLTGVNPTSSNAGTGGGVDKYAVVVSESVWHYTDNVGVPKSKAWKTDLDGSYFNNFDHNTDTAEILRFIAGLLSASAPDASPNTRVYNNISEQKSNTGTGTAPLGTVPSQSTDDTVLYLQGKGFADSGSTIFEGISPIYNNSGYSIDYNSVASGSTTVSSSNDTQLFGLGNQNDAFNVSGSQEWYFFDNADQTQTYTTSSETLLTKTGEGTANGLTIGNIPTSDPLIPEAYQDGKFAGVFDAGLENNVTNGFNNYTESVGYYHISTSVAIASGSGNYSDFKVQNEEIFYANTSQLNTLIGDNSRTLGYNGTASLTATSRSLSGAPYLRTATWEASSSVNGVFNPLFVESTTCARLVENSSLVTISAGGTGNYILSTVGGTIQTANVVFDSTGTTARSTGTVPGESDLIKLTGSLSFNAGSGGSTNVGSTSISPTSFNLTTQARNRSNSDTTLNTTAIPFHVAGTFDQPSASGSMGYYGRAQGYDGGSLTAFTEQFTGENFRIKIEDDLLSGSYASGSHFVTASFDVSELGSLDLQVKPSRLVFPGGTYGYWFPDPDNTKDYKFYARAFKRDLSTGATSMTLNIGKTLNNWESTSDGVSAAIVFRSAGPEGDSSHTVDGRLYDPTVTDANLISGSVANDDHKNPFSETIELYGNNAGSINGTTYTIPISNSQGKFLNSTFRDFIVIIRYKGDPSPVTNVTITIS